MGTKYYKSLYDLKEIDDVLKLTDNVLATKHVVITNTNNAPKIVAASIAAVAGTGAAIVGTGAIGAGVAGGLGVGAMGAAGLAGGVALAPVALPLALVTGIGYLLFKNKKAKELNEALQFRNKKAVEKQNQVIRKYNNLLQMQEKEMEKKEANYKEIINQQAKKIDELLAIIDSLQQLRNRISAQLAA